MPRRILEGDVVSAKTNKTITVLVERRFMHPMYKKYVKRTDKYAAHDENNQFKVGDRVRIQECRPISKTKRWTVLVDGSKAPAGAPRGMTKSETATAKAEKPAAKKEAAAKKPAAAAKKTTSKKKDA